jgi:hypothetical protein
MDADSAQAYRSMQTLAAAPDQTVAFLSGRMLRKKIAPQQIARLLTDLDSEEFRVRLRAAKELEKLGDAAEPALRRALKNKPSVEVRQRILELLEKLGPPHPEGIEPRLLRGLRALEVLEWVDTAAARRMLEHLAADPPREEIGEEAKAALKRLRTLSNRDKLHPPYAADSRRELSE